MKRKRVISILAAAVMVFCLAGCQMNDAGAEQTSGESQQVSAVTESVAETSSAVTEITDRSEENNNLIVPVNKKLIKVEDGDHYGYKDNDGNIVIPVIYSIRNHFRNADITAEAYVTEDRSYLYYIDKDGNVLLETNDVPVFYTDFYNGYTFFDGRFIDEQGNTVYESIHTRNIDRVMYWGNGYFEQIYHPSYNGIGYTGHSCFIDVHGNEKISTADVRVSELIDGYAVINGGGWSVIVDSDLKVKAVFLNTISVMPNYVMTSVVYNYDFDERKYLLKIIKGYRPVTEPYDSDDIDEIKKIFKDDYDPENVPVYIYDGERTEIYLEDWNKYDVEYDYEIVDVQSIINNEKSPVQGVSEKNTETGEKDIISECINDFKNFHNRVIIDHMLYDIDGDNNDELLILSEGALLYNCSELHIYRIDNGEFKYCGSIDTLLQRELYDDISDRNSEPMAYSKLDIKKFSCGEISYNCVFTSSVRTAFSQWNYVSAVAFDEDDMITEIPLLMWGIDIPAEYREEELIPEYYFYNEGVPEEVTYEDVRYYLSLLEDTSAGE